MQSKKESKLLEKIVKKDYKNKLEEVLENKIFGENAKSLLLEILYKLETAYSDYEMVKKDAKTRDEYIEDFINSVKNNCKTIKIVQPNSEQSKILNNKTFKINKEKGEIVCFPIARKLLYAIAKLEKKDKIILPKYYLLSKTFSNMITIGDNINVVEPLRDFDGWSWSTVAREYESIEYNMIYQILLMIVGREFLSEWMKNGNTIIDYMEELEHKLVKEYGVQNAKEIIVVLNKLSVVMELKVNPNMREEIIGEKARLEELLDKFDDKEGYITELTSKKNSLNRKIKKIDTTISNKELLQEEYIKRNDQLPLEKKIFSMRILAQIMTKERKELVKEMEEYNSLLKPQIFLAKKDEIKNEYEILKLANFKNIESELSKNFLHLHEMFLECFKIKVENAETKQDVLNLFYKFRYYNLLPSSTSESIFNTDNLQNKLSEVGKILVSKAVNTRTIPKIAENEVINYEITKYLFVTRIVNLEELSIKIVKEKENYFLQFFDNKTNDEKIKLEVDGLDKSILKVKLNKKIKMFE